MIIQITKVYTRHYRDNGQTTTYVEWLDGRGTKGRTEGEPSSAHMMALKNRAVREGVELTNEVW